jgi:ParB family chromosome partitioning protein
VRQTEALVSKWQVKDQRAVEDGTKNPDIQNLEQKLSEQLGAGVLIQHSKGGKGKLVIRYNNLDELDGILSHIKEVFWVCNVSIKIAKSLTPLSVA